MNKAILRTGGLVALPLLLGGCIANMPSVGTQDAAHGAQGKEYAPVTGFRAKANAQFSELVKVNGQDTLALPPANCRFKDGQWNQEFKSKALVYFGKCDAAGFAEGFGGLFLKSSGGKGAPPQFAFAGSDKEFPVLVGDFKEGQPHGQGYLTAEVNTRSLWESLGLVDPKTTEAKFIEDAKKNAKGRPVAPDGQLKQTYGYYRQQAESSYAGWSDTTRIPVYVGDFVAGRQAGKAIIFSRDNQLVYSGDIKDGKKHGIGRYFYPEFFAEKGRHAQSKQMRLIAAEGQFKDDKLDGVATAMYTQCKKLTANYERGEFKPGYATYREPTRVDQEQFRASKSSRPVYIYGKEMTSWMDKSLEPMKRGFASWKWQDDDYTYSVTGTFNEQGKEHGDFVITRFKKKFGDVTNSQRVALIGREEVYTGKYVDGVEQPVAEEEKKASSADWGSLLERLIKARNPAVDSAAIAKGLASTTITMFSGVLGDPCEDLGEAAQDLQAKIDEMSSFYKALGPLSKLKGKS